MQENAGKILTRITPNTDTFYAVKEIDPQGSKEKLKYKIIGKTFEKLKSRVQKTYQFMSRLNPDNILDKSRAWKMNQLSAHIQGNKLNALHRATNKAYEMLCSRKIVIVEIFKGEHNTTSSKLYVKSAINRSYGETRKFVILLNSENIPEKSNCKCSVYQVD